MPTRRIDPDDAYDDPRREVCRHPEHALPSHMLFRSGTYEHECPGCGHRVVFTVAGGVL